MSQTTDHSLTDSAARTRLIDYLRANGADSVNLASDSTRHLLKRLAVLTGAHGSESNGDIYLDSDAGEFAGWWRA